MEEGETLVLQCDTRANPVLLSISWELNGSMVDLLADGFTMTSDGVTSVLQASKVEKSVHEGTYKCTTNSPSYGRSSKLFHVTVTGQFSCSKYLMALFHVLLLPGLCNLQNQMISSSADKTKKFPLMPMIAGLVVVFLTTLLAIVSRWKKIARVTSDTYTQS